VGAIRTTAQQSAAPQSQRDYDAINLDMDVTAAA
jgi:hypothetical protein